MTGSGILLALPSVPPIHVLSGDASWRARQDCGECQSPRLTNIGGHLCAFLGKQVIFPSLRLTGCLCYCMEFLEDCSSSRCSGCLSHCNLSPVGSIHHLGAYCRSSQHQGVPVGASASWHWRFLAVHSSPHRWVSSRHAVVFPMFLKTVRHQKQVKLQIPSAKRSLRRHDS